jgi:hypothetical protein
MAGLGRKVFAAGDVLAAADVDGYLMDQTVMTFAGTAARSSAIGTASEGMYTYLSDSNDTQFYNGSAWESQFGKGRNAIINGGFDFWQRGTSFNGAGLLYSADRWTYWRDAYASGITASRQLSGDTANLPNAKYCLRIARDSGNSNTGLIYTNQPITNDDSLPLIGKTITLSAWIRKGANFSGSTVSMLVRSGTGTDQPVNNMTGATTVATTPAAVTTTWQRFTVTGTVGASATQLGVEFNYTPTGTAGAADYFEVANVQLEAGSVATPFSRAGGTLQGELAACQRYFYRKANGGTYMFFGNGRANNTTTVEAEFKMPVTMRVTPTSLEYGGTLASYDGITISNISSMAFNTNQLTADSCVLVMAGTGFTQFRPYTLISNNSTTSYVGINAEL